MLDSLRPTHPRRLSLLLLAGLLTFAVAAPASAQTGVQFNGSNQYIDLTQATGTLGATTFTLEVWFKRTGTGLATNTGSGGVSAIPLVTKGQNENPEGTTRDMNYFLGIRASDSVLVADFEEGAGQAQPGFNHPVIGRTVIRSHTWYHAAAVYNGTGWSLYLNGILDTAITIGPGRLPQAASIQYAALGGSLNSSGATVGGTSGFFAGVLDEARIWGVPRTGAGIRDSAAIEITSAPGLLGRWGLNDGSGTTAVNSVAGSPDGTLANGPTWVTGSPFAYFYGLKFTGSSSYVTMGNVGGLSNFTVETWFRRDGSGATASTGAGGVTAVPLVAKGVDQGEASNTDVNYFLGIDGSGRLVTDFEEGAAGASPGLNHPLTGTTSIANGSWNHAAATYDGTTLRLFLNGQVEGTLTVGQPAQSASIQHLGLATALNSTGIASGFLNGALDETRLWDAARSQTDIQSTINSAITSPTTNLVGRWGMNEGANRVVRDTSGSAIHGTVYPGSISNTWGWVPNTPFGLVFYDLNVSVVGSGSVSKSPDQVNYNSGSLVQLTATPGANYQFTGWSGDAGGAANPLSVTMDATKNITATFALNTYDIVVTAGAGGSITPSGTVSVTHGSDQTFDITPATGYHVADVLVDGGSVGAVTTYTFTNVTTTHTIDASFAINSYALNVTVVGSGSVARFPDQALYDHGTQVQLTATADPHWGLAGWSGDASGSANPLIVTMDAAKNITATFVPTHTLTTAVDPEASGSVTRNPDLPAYNQGSSVQLTAVPATGYHFVEWSGDLTGSTNPENLLIDADKSITAHFALNQYAVNVTVVGNGSVGNYPDQPLYDYGSVVQLLPVPEEGYAFTGWSGDATGTDIPLSVTVDGEKNITATFTTATTGVDGTPVTEFALSAIAPNPIAGRARFRIALPEAASIRLSLLDLQGREVAVLADGVYAPGRHTIEWTRSHGRIASGMYFARFRTPVGSFTRRVVLAR